MGNDRTLALQKRARLWRFLDNPASRGTASVMIEKFAGICRTFWSEFLDLNHTSKLMVLVSLLIPKFALRPSRELLRTSELGH